MSGRVAAVVVAAGASVAADDDGGSEDDDADDEEEDDDDDDEEEEEGAFAALGATGVERSNRRQSSPDASRCRRATSAKYSSRHSAASLQSVCR